MTDLTPAQPSSAGRHWSDWAGFLLNIGFAAVIWSRSAALGILLLPTLWYELLVAGSFLLRRGAGHRLSGWWPRVAAYGGSFLLLGFVQAALVWKPDWVAASGVREMRIVGTVLWVGGSLFGLWPLWHLRRAFSLEPHARELITSGPYRFIRHPIYTMYLLNYLGLWLARATVPFALAILGWLALTLWRVRYEERVLTEAFPAYGDYRQRAGMFLPRLRPR